MTLSLERRSLLAAAAAAAMTATSRRARAANKPLKIGVLNDMTGVFADYQGPGSAVAARMAAEDAAAIAGRPIEIVTGDHQNKPDIGMVIARRWIDQEGVDVILDVPNSAVALAVAGLARERNKVFICSGAGLTDLTTSRCSPNTVQWTYDSWQLSHTLGRAITLGGGKTWFLLNSDYAFGADLERNMTDAVTKVGGTIVGTVKHPFPATDFSSYLLAAQASGAQVLGLNNAGDDLVNAIKQAGEFGLMRTMKIAAPVFNVNMVHAVGLLGAQGVLGVTSFYWDANDASRAFATRFAAALRSHAMPNDMQAGCYSGLMHLAKALAKIGGTEDGAAVVAAMKAIPTSDGLFGEGVIRADGRKFHPIHLIEAKTPAESTGPWDYFKVITTIPADEAYRPMAEGGCALVRP